MKLSLVLLVFGLAISAFAKEETRCGWISNPTPANYWIDDADGSWTIGVQGGFQAKGVITAYPTDSQMVNTNGNYGYWCGCVRGTFDPITMLLLNISSSSVKNLDVCLEDSNLPKF